MGRKPIEKGCKVRSIHPSAMGIEGFAHAYFRKGDLIGENDEERFWADLEGWLIDRGGGYFRLLPEWALIRIDDTNAKTKTRDQELEHA